LNKELATYKRINAALQIRRTIEKLVFELPDTARYEASGSGPRWKTLWKDTWKDAATNPRNPFHELWKSATGQYAKREYETKGADLFREMSGEIHGYDKRDFDYEHFDTFTRGIANVLRPKSVNQNTGEVNWKSEVNKYKVFWTEGPGAGS